jgi:MraZ protein
MSIYSGEYECKLDAKGRLVLPARIKAALPKASGNELMLRRGFEPCLVLYSMEEYNEKFAKLASLNEFNEEYRTLQRNFFRGNTPVELDNMGRFLIPKMMLKHAQLEKDVILVGAGDRIEIWNPDAYEEYLIKDSAEFSKLAQKHLLD